MRLLSAVKPELVAAIIAAAAALVSAALTTYAQFRVTALQAEVRRRGEQERFLLSHYASVGAYCVQQYQALREGYLILFGREPGLNSTHDQAIKLVGQADDEVMAPLRNFENLLDQKTRYKIYEIHNLLAQIRDNPSPKAIEQLRQSKGRVFGLVNEARELLDPQGVLQRKGILGK